MGVKKRLFIHTIKSELKKLKLFWQLVWCLCQCLYAIQFGRPGSPYTHISVFFLFNSWLAVGVHTAPAGLECIHLTLGCWCKTLNAIHVYIYGVYIPVATCEP